MSTLSRRHTHSTMKSVTRPFCGHSVGYRENKAAHGGITVIEFCRCGASRKFNINQNHVEHGPWVDDSDEEYNDNE